MNDFAAEIIALGETMGWLFSIGAVLIGCAIADHQLTDTRTMRRGPYFLALGAIAAAVNFLSLVALMAAIRIAPSGQFMLMLIILYAPLLAAGYAIGWISRRRSNDRFGDGRATMLGAVPIAFLWMIFGRSRHPRLKPENRSARIALNASCVIGGLVLFFLGSAFAGLMNYIA